MESLRSIEGATITRGRAKRASPPEMPGQLSLFGDKHVVVDELAKLDVASLTPLEAITKLFKLQKKARS